ncbi:MAG: hypothetical protein IJJ41_01655 [Clostridia bacterium]|nr:hypothetical protein [Clostridia bacterium]MBR0414191.1 hypothetical protein [Clostridia bacterium]
MTTKGVKTKYIGAVIIVLVLFYIGFQVFQITYNPIKTITATKETVYDSITKDAVFIRDEQVITAGKSGTMVYDVKDGSRVEKGGTIANVFASDAEAKTYAQLSDIEKQITYYENIILQNTAGNSSLEVIDSNIENSVNEYVRAINSGNLAAAEELNGNLIDNVNNRKITIGESIDVNSILNELYAKRKNLQSQVAKKDAVVAEEAGYFVSSVDGSEGAIDYKKATELSVSNINNILKSGKNKADKNAVGKIVKSFDWYIACSVDRKNIADVKVGGIVSVSFPQADVGELEATVAAINADAENANKVAFILKLGNMDEHIAKMRAGKVEIRFNKYEGIRIPNDALRAVTTKDKETGEEKTVKCVYVLSGNLVKLKFVNIIYTGEDFVIAQSNTTQTGYVRLYDRIIVKGEDLSDGKVVKYQPAN